MAPKTFEEDDPLAVHQGERVQLRWSHMSRMLHRMHVHGHTFAVIAKGVRKDTVIVRPLQSLVFDLRAEDPASGRPTVTTSTTPRRAR